MLFKLLPRLKSSGARLACRAKSGDLPGLLAGRPTPSAPRTGAMVAASPEWGGVWGLVLVAGAAADGKCWGWELLPQAPPPPEAIAGAVADCCRGTSLSSCGGASEKRLTSGGRLRGVGP